MFNPFKSLIRASSFFGKEIMEVVRQPRLILALILGPFLILLLFGIGYRNEARAVRTLFVAQPDSPMAKQIEADAPNFSPQLVYVGLEGDEQDAKRRLLNNEVDMVVVAPSDAYQLIQNNQQAAFTVYHNEIDPSQAGYIEYLANTYIAEINRRVVSSIAQQGQTEATDLSQNVTKARQNVAAMRQALQTGDVATAQAQQLGLQSNLSSLSLAIGTSAGLLASVQQNSGNSSTPEASNAQNILSLLTDIKNNQTNNTQIQSGKTDYSQEIASLDKTDQDLANLQQQLSTFQQISPNVLVSPFTVNTQSVSNLKFTQTNFFTPGVVALLLQHVAVTIAALSIVRERRSGTIELFRVSPVSSLETLVGKYLSYLLFSAFIGVALALLLAYGLNAPMLGNWVYFGLVGLALIFASLGLGFFISLIADTESQAVQFSMIVLLLSVFFSGFMLDLRYIWQPVQIISYLLPATHAISLFQDIMLRGEAINQIYMGGLLLIGLVLFVISFLLLRRRMAQE